MTSVIGPQQPRAMRLLEALRDARKTFFEDLLAFAEHFAADKPDKLSIANKKMLNSANSYQMAELYYILDVYDVNTRARVEEYLREHNRRMGLLRLNPDLLSRMGLDDGDVLAATIPPGQLHFAVMNALDGRFPLQRASLGRLLRLAMSPTTTNAVIAAMLTGGLLTERTTDQGVQFIVSNGKKDLESIFRHHLELTLAGI